MSEHVDVPEPELPVARATGRALWRDRDHTRGSLFASLAMLALPLVGTSLVGGVLFQVVDLMLISGLGDQALTAIVVTNQSLRQIFLMLVMGASFGAQGLIARSIGEREPERADHVAGQTAMLGLMLSALLALLGVAVPREMLALMNVSAEALELGVPYVRLVFLLGFAFVFTSLAAAILNGSGDTTTPFRISIVQTFVALAAEWVLIDGHLGMPALGVEGVAIGLGLGQLVGLAMLARALSGGRSRIHIRGRHMRPDPALLRVIVSLSWPPAVQLLGGFLVTIFFIRVMGEFGEAAQAAYSIGLRLAMIPPTVCMPLAGAVATLVGQNLGANDVPRAWRAMGVGIVVNSAVMGSAALVFYLFPEELFGLFTQDPEVIAIGGRMLVWQAGQFALTGFFFVLFRALQGAGDVLVPMAMSLANALLLSLPLGLYLSRTRGMGPDGVFVAQFVATLVGTMMLAGWVATGRWTTARQRALRRI